MHAYSRKLSDWMTITSRPKHCKSDTLQDRDALSASRFPTPSALLLYMRSLLALRCLWPCDDYLAQEKVFLRELRHRYTRFTRYYLAREAAVRQASVLNSFLTRILKVCSSMSCLEKLFGTLLPNFSKTIVWTTRSVIAFMIFSQSDFQQIGFISHLGLSFLLDALARSGSAQLYAEIRAWQRVCF
jgi:hypothetical protein